MLHSVNNFKINFVRVIFFYFPDLLCSVCGLDQDFCMRCPAMDMRRDDLDVPERCHTIGLLV